jgi:uncharacterized membrane protein
MTARFRVPSPERSAPGGAGSDRGAGGGAAVRGAERWVSLVAGGGLASLSAYTAACRSPLAAAAALASGYLIYRGAAGYCPVSDTLGLPTLSAPSEPLQVERSVTINRSAADLYTFWRNLENLPRFMQHLETVRVQGPTRSHWVANAPGGAVVEWDAEIVEERENELIAWRSLPGSQVDAAGSVRFHPATGGRGTVVTARLEYVPPAGSGRPW